MVGRQLARSRHSTVITSSFDLRDGRVTPWPPCLSGIARPSLDAPRIPMLGGNPDLGAVDSSRRRNRSLFPLITL